jgi:hypothetical protein
MAARVYTVEVETPDHINDFDIIEAIFDGADSHLDADGYGSVNSVFRLDRDRG